MRKYQCSNYLVEHFACCCLAIIIESHIYMLSIDCLLYLRQCSDENVPKLLGLYRSVFIQLFHFLWSKASEFTRQHWRILQLHQGLWRFLLSPSLTLMRPFRNKVEHEKIWGYKSRYFGGSCFLSNQHFKSACVSKWAQHALQSLRVLSSRRRCFRCITSL